MWLCAAMVLAACHTGPYRPTPVEIAAPMPEDAFARCRALVGARFGAIAFADEERFLLQSGWQPTSEPRGERRVSVFREGGGLAVLVEVHEVVESLFSLPEWGPVHGDEAAEHELAAALAANLAARPAIGER